jgi:hypothetical protein
VKILELLEARKKPEMNKKHSTLDKLLQISKQHPNSFVTFTTVDKLGINPKSTYDTPIGIYSYPIKYVIDEEGQVPFAGSSPNVQVFEYTGSNMWNLSDDIQDIQPRIIKALEAKQFDATAAKEATNAKQLWYAMYKGISNIPAPAQGGSLITKMIQASQNPKAKRRNSITRSILMAAGIDAILDWGHGIIHTNEPTQALFLNNQVIKSVASFDNKKREFEDLKLMLINMSRSNYSQFMFDKTSTTLINDYHCTDKWFVELLLKDCGESALDFMRVELLASWPALEQEILKTDNDRMALRYAITNKIQHPQLEQLILQSSDLRLITDYVLKVKKKRWPEYEAKLKSIRKPDATFLYTSGLIKLGQSFK